MSEIILNIFGLVFLIPTIALATVGATSILGELFHR